MTILLTAVALLVVALLVKRRNNRSGHPLSGMESHAKKSRMNTEQQPPRTENESYREDVLQEVYERTENCFRQKQPYLDSGLTIHEVAALIYTNKSYVSKAISRYAGMNFCQYVNQWRIRYAVRIFQEDPGLRVNELAQKSGFNSQATFNIAFRAYLNESPSQWCRENRRNI